MESYQIAIVSGTLAALPGVLALWAQRRKVQADTASVLTGAALQMVEEARAEAKAAREEARLLRTELLAARDEVANIRNQLVSAMERVRQLEAENAKLTHDLGKAEETLVVLAAENHELRQQFEALGKKPDTGPLRRKNAQP